MRRLYVKRPPVGIKMLYVQESFQEESQRTKQADEHLKKEEEEKKETSQRESTIREQADPSKRQEDN